MTTSFKINFLKGSAAASIGTLFSIVFHFLSIMLLTRFIPREEFGLYVLILVIASFINILTGLGLNLTLVKFIASDDSSEKRGVLVAVLLTRTISLLIVGLIFIFARHLILNLFDQQLNDFFIFIPFLFFATSFRDLFYNLLQGLNLFKKYATVQSFSAVLRVVFILMLIFLHALNLRNLIYMEIISTVLGIIFQLLITPKKLFDFSYPGYPDYKKIMKFSAPLYLNDFFNFLIERVNIFIIGAFLNPVSIAYFDVAEKVPDALKRMFSSFIAVYFPNVSILFSQKRKKSAQDLMNNSLTIFSTGITFLFLICYLFRQEIIVLIFSDKYLPSANAFGLLILAFYFKAITNIIGYSIVAAGFSSIPVRANIISSVLGLLISLVVIPGFGFIGAAYSILIMNIISHLIHFIYAKKLHIYPNIKEYLKPLVFSMILTGFHLILNLEIILLKFTYLAVYCTLAWIFIKEIRKNLEPVFKYISNILIRKIGQHITRYQKSEGFNGYEK